jgi:DNA-binding IclR family transcriptional regulator
MARSDSGESVLERVMRILEVFRSGDRFRSINQIAEAADLPRSTAHRLVLAMIEQGLLDRTSDGAVTIGTRVWEISHRASADLELRQAAMPLMENLLAIVQQHVQLSILKEDEVLYLEGLSHPGAVANIAHIAIRLPLNICAPGLVFCAYGPESLRRRVLSRPLPAYTDASIVDAGKFRRALAFVRRFEYAVTPDYTVPGSKGVGVPIWGPGPHPVAALSIVIGTHTDHLTLVHALRATARAISIQLGARNDVGSDIIRQHNPS